MDDYIAQISFLEGKIRVKIWDIDAMSRNEVRHNDLKYQGNEVYKEDI